MSLKRKRSSAANGEAVASSTEVVADAVSNDPDREQPSKRANASRSLFVRSLPQDATTDSLAEHFSDSYPIKHANVVLDPTTKKPKGYGFVTFADEEDAQRAKEEFNGSIYKGKHIQVEVAEPRHRNSEHEGSKSKPSAEFLKAQEGRKQQREHQPPPKLIIRNLPWSIKTTEQLSQLFLSYGKIKQATLPQTKAGLSPGFGFVVLRGKKNAEKALAGVNGKVIDGRTLAVDWAVQKDQWQAAQEQEVKSEDDEDDKDSLKSEDEGGVNLEEIPPSDAEFGDLTSGDEDEDEDEDDLKMDDDDDDDDDLDEDEDEKANATEDKSTTIFIRNLPFTSTDDTLYAHFKDFGPLRYARVVMDYETDRSKGVGFVCFHKIEDAKECLRKSPKTNIQSAASKANVKHSLLQDTATDPSGLFTLEGRVLQISAAVGRGEAQRLTEQGHTAREARDKDKRRLYLLSEGTISSNSPLYSAIAPSEIKLREDSAKQRQTLIRNNPSLHLSLTRLAIRNLPRFVTSKDLKAMAREAVVAFAKTVKEGRRSKLSPEELSRGGPEMREAEKQRKMRKKGIVNQAKVVFEGSEGSKVEESSGAGKSRGYGFIEYSSHRWALMGLRHLNGHLVKPQGGRTNENPAQDKSKRLIVEFAIENAQVVARRREREQKARENPSTGREKGGKEDEDGERPAKKKRLSKNQLKNKARFDARDKKRSDAKHPSSETAKASGSKVDDAASKTSKRQKIIGRKRAMRKARRNGP